LPEFFLKYACDPRSMRASTQTVAKMATFDRENQPGWRIYRRERQKSAKLPDFLAAARLPRVAVATVTRASDAFIRHNAQAGFAEAGRPLLDPSEILRLPRDQVLVFITGSSRSAILATRLVYYKERYFRGLWDRWRGGAAHAAMPASASVAPGTASPAPQNAAPLPAVAPPPASPTQPAAL
jgi:hypothetical protein